MHAIKKLFAALAILAMLATPAMGMGMDSRKGTLDAEKTHPMWDLMFLRPMGAVGLIFTTAFWVPVQGICMITRPSEWRKPIDYMLKEPYEFVFVDPIGSH